MKKILISTTFIFLALTPFLFGNHGFYQNQNVNQNGAEGSNNNTSHLRNCTVIEDAILLMEKKNNFINSTADEEDEIDDWDNLDFVTILSQRPITEGNKILSQSQPFQNFAILELKTITKNGEVKLYNKIGEMVVHQNFKGKQFEIQRNELQSGIYFYCISDEGKAINAGKIIIN